jgi:serine/threonine-protein kinase HipA
MVDHLKSWGELEEMAPEICEFVINGHIIKNIRMEQAYKGNFHLLIEIDGHERKFIIGKNREEFSLIESMGIANLSSERLKDMVEKYFIL